MSSRSILLRFLKLILLTALVVMIPLAGAGLIYDLQRNAFQDTYYAELPKKITRLTKQTGRRIVIVGGSSVAFGIDSKLVEQELGIPCINFGLYAAFGLKPMLDLSVRRLHQGDIVIIAPETSSQMYSTYCGYDYLLQALETRPSILTELGPGYYPGLVSALPGYIQDAAALRAQGGAPVTGVYTLSSFDEFGDIIYPRPENVLDRGYTQDNLPELSPDIVTDSFLDMINDYTQAAHRRGAQVYFSFCPINALSVASLNAVEREAFVQALRDGLECPLLSPLADHILDAGYFYDSNYHLNDTGMRYNTLILIADVQRIQGEMYPASETLPHPPTLQRENAILASGNENGIIYEVTARGAIITGLDEQGRTLQTLNIPQTLGGANVISVSAEAFADCAAEEITLPDTITHLSGRLFNGATRLEKVNLLSASLPEVGDELLSGANPSLRIYVPANMYGSYIADYFWGAYSERLEAM